MDSERWLMRWWPMLYAVVWAVWAFTAPVPYVFDIEVAGHILAAFGAVGLIAMGLFPQRKMVRFFGTLAAVAYPLHRAMSIAVDETYFPGTTRRIVAVGFCLIVVLSLLVMYPSLWWVARRKGSADGQ